ncbi:MAG: DNA polymerase III subunit beta [bacterium]
MKLVIAKDAVMSGLQLVHGVVNVRPTLPVLSNVLMEAKNDKLWLTTTDMEVTMRCAVEAKTGKAGSTTIPARRLFSIIRELPADNIEIEVDEKNAASITCGSAFFKINGLPDDEFPAIPKSEDGHTFTVEQKVLKQMLQKTFYAASTDETRFILNGTLMSFKGNKLTLVATDGRRLALTENEIEFPKEAECEAIVPTKAINELIRILKDEGSIKVHIGKNQASFEFDEVMLTTKLIEGTYPNFRQVIPGQCEQRIAVDREVLLTALKRVALLTSEKSSSIKLTFGKNKLKISASSPDVGEAHESVAIKYNAKEIQVAFNPDYIMEPLRNIANDEIYVELTDELSPGVIKCDVPFIYVLMPMRIS